MNRERLIEHGAVIELFNLVLGQAEHEGLLSGEHFSPFRYTQAATDPAELWNLD